MRTKRPFLEVNLIKLQKICCFQEYNFYRLNMYTRLCSIFGLWITCSTIYPGFKMATIFWICCVKTVRHPNDPPKKLLFNLAVTKLLAVKIVGKCQIAPLNSIFWVFKMKFLKKKIFLKNFENIF